MPEPPPAVAATLHGHELHYVDTGSGPAIVFLHGLLGSHRDWALLLGDLSESHRVIALDLFGHGASAKPRGDYSLGAHAATVRDLLDHLGIGAVTIVGHSLGGGIALQFSYLFPDRVTSLVLVSSGGLGRELSVLLRVSTLPGVEWVLPAIASGWVRNRGEQIGRGLARTGVRPGHDVRRAWDGFVSLGDPETRRAFLATSRAVIDPGGQTVTARHRLPVLASMPVLLVWGARDRLIPAWHAMNAQEEMPNSRVVIFDKAGHFPHLDEPERFAALVGEFVDGLFADEEPVTDGS